MPPRCAKGVDGLITPDEMLVGRCIFCPRCTVSSTISEAVKQFICGGDEKDAINNMIKWCNQSPRSLIRFKLCCEELLYFAITHLPD